MNDNQQFTLWIYGLSIIAFFLSMIFYAIYREMK